MSVVIDARPALRAATAAAVGAQQAFKAEWKAVHPDDPHGYGGNPEFRDLNRAVHDAGAAEAANISDYRTLDDEFSALVRGEIGAGWGPFVAGLRDALWCWGGIAPGAKPR